MFRPLGSVTFELSGSRSTKNIYGSGSYPCCPYYVPNWKLEVISTSIYFYPLVTSRICLPWTLFISNVVFEIMFLLIIAGRWIGSRSGKSEYRSEDLNLTDAEHCWKIASVAVLQCCCAPVLLCLPVWLLRICCWTSRGQLERRKFSAWTHGRLHGMNDSVI